MPLDAIRGAYTHRVYIQCNSRRYPHLMLPLSCDLVRSTVTTVSAWIKAMPAQSERPTALASPPHPVPPTPRWSRSRLPQLWLDPRRTEAAPPPPRRPAAHAEGIACSSHCRQLWRQVACSPTANSARPRRASELDMYCPRTAGPPGTLQSARRTCSQAERLGCIQRLRSSALDRLGSLRLHVWIRCTSSGLPTDEGSG